MSVVEPVYDYSWRHSCTVPHLPSGCDCNTTRTAMHGACASTEVLCCCPLPLQGQLAVLDVGEVCEFYHSVPRVAAAAACS
jgi:hypothetical protein